MKNLIRVVKYLILVLGLVWIYECCIEAYCNTKNNKKSTSKVECDDVEENSIEELDKDSPNNKIKKAFEKRKYIKLPMEKLRSNLED